MSDSTPNDQGRSTSNRQKREPSELDAEYSVLDVFSLLRPWVAMIAVTAVLVAIAGGFLEHSRARYISRSLFEHVASPNGSITSYQTINTRLAEAFRRSEYSEEFAQAVFANLDQTIAGQNALSESAREARAFLIREFGKGPDDRAGAEAGFAVYLMNEAATYGTESSVLLSRKHFVFQMRAAAANGAWVCLLDLPRPGLAKALVPAGVAALHQLIERINRDQLAMVDQALRGDLKKTADALAAFENINQEARIADEKLLTEKKIAFYNIINEIEALEKQHGVAFAENAPSPAIIVEGDRAYPVNAGGASNIAAMAVQTAQRIANLVAKGVLDHDTKEALVSRLSRHISDIRIITYRTEVYLEASSAAATNYKNAIANLVRPVETHKITLPGIDLAASTDLASLKRRSLDEKRAKVARGIVTGLALGTVLGIGIAFLLALAGTIWPRLKSSSRPNLSQTPLRHP